MRKVTRAIVLTSLSVLVLAPLSFCVALPIALNEVKAVGWGLQYGQMAHPPGTQRIALRQGIEKLSNGDNCDFLILEARAYVAGDEAAIQAFYAQRPNPIDASQNSLWAKFVEAADRVPREIEPYASFRSEVQRLYQGSYYLLEVWQVVESAPPLIDWRCP